MKFHYNRKYDWVIVGAFLLLGIFYWIFWGYANFNSYEKPLIIQQ